MASLHLVYSSSGSYSMSRPASFVNVSYGRGEGGGEGGEGRREGQAAHRPYDHNIDSQATYVSLPLSACMFRDQKSTECWKETEKNMLSHFHRE